MKKIALIQLPIPQHNFGIRTGNIPLAAACLKQAADDMEGFRIEIIPETVATYLGDAAIIDYILKMKPDIIGFTIFNWNLFRSLYISKTIKDEYQPKIIFGGPEITADNLLTSSDHVDFQVFGEGETSFLSLLSIESLWSEKKCQYSAESVFKSSPSPYIKGYLDQGINNIIYIESQRGCPYRCGFCYYNKSRKKPVSIGDDMVLKALEWAVEKKVEEFSFIDPSLNTRPGLSRLLKMIAEINKKTISITGEIRADKIDAETAELFSNAGFTGFEIGLQSINPTALDMMNRKTDLDLFLKGTSHLVDRDILPRIDLIVGLPGDTLDGFKKSVDFISENRLTYDVQVFPLSVLPGTDFRKNHKELGIFFDQMPPYTVTKTGSFSEEEMQIAFDYAESAFDISLFPDANIDLSFYREKGNSSHMTDHTVLIDNNTFISKLVLNPERPLNELLHLSKKVTHPYQVIIPRNNNELEKIKHSIEILTEQNPFTPLELIFHDPSELPDTSDLLDSVRLERPQYLDNDLRFQYREKGNRSVLFTVLTEKKNLCFEGEMKRQVYWWKYSRLPELKILEELWELDGILIDTNISKDTCLNWQKKMARHKNDILYISFSDMELQKKWMERTSPGDYYSNII